MDMMNDLMAQTYASNIKWPKDQVLAIRVQHIVKCIKDGKFPVQEGHSLGQILAELQDNDDSPFDSKSPDSNLRESLTPLSESSAENPGSIPGVQQGQKSPGGLPHGLQVQKVPNLMGSNKDHQGLPVESTSKIRQLLTQALPNKPMPPGMGHDDLDNDDVLARLTKNRGISGNFINMYIDCVLLMGFAQNLGTIHLGIHTLFI